MVVLQALNITKSYGITPILTNLTIQVHAKDKIGIVGPNGAGKSTFLKIIAKLMPPDNGTIQISRGIKISYLAQDSGLESERTIWDEMLSAFDDLHKQEQQLRKLESLMGSIPADELTQVMEQYSILHEGFERAGGYQLEADIRNVLAGLGFANMQYNEHLISRCSGGQKTRLALAKILLSKPDIILLDEPTNYLDIDALTWLEQFIKDFAGALLVVSHDRYFLDSFVTVIYEIDNHNGTKYEGNYAYYLAIKEQRYQEQEKLFLQQQEEIAKTEEFIQKNIARATTSNRAKSKRKQLEKVELIAAPKRQSQTFFSFHTKKRSGNIALTIEDLAMSFANQTHASNSNNTNATQPYLFSGLELLVERGERVAIIGPNGTGKSTLLKLIMQRLQPTKGNITLGSNIQIGYYDQEQADLQGNNTVFDEIHNDFPHMTKTEVRSALAQFLFVGDDVDKRINSLSGGEKARVTLTKLMLAEDNFLLLDEPTNHLDITAKDVLEKALINYDGTMIFISHDRYFLNQIATKIVYMTTDQLEVYLGNYDYYLEKKQQMLQIKQQAKQNINIAHGSSNKSINTTNKVQADQKETHEQLKKRRNLEKQLSKQYEQIEADIQSTESAIAKIEGDLCDPTIFDNHIEIQKLHDQLNINQQKLTQLLDEWEHIATKLENIEPIK